MTAILEDLKVCRHCGVSQPISEFKRRSKAQGQRLSWCRECVNAAARKRAAVKKDQILGQAMKYVRLETPAPRVEAVVAVMCRKLGSIEAFADRLHEAITGPNLSLAVRAGDCLLKLAIAAERLRNESLQSLTETLKAVNNARRRS